MARTLDDYRRKLVDKILLSASPQEARRFTDTAIRSLTEHKVHGYIILRFLDKTIFHLEEATHRCIDPDQASNIKVAIEHLKQVRRICEVNPVS